MRHKPKGVRYQPKRYTTSEGVEVYDEITTKTGGFTRLSRHPKTGEAMLGVGRDGEVISGVRLNPEEVRHLRNALTVYLYRMEHGTVAGNLAAGRPWKNTPHPPLPPQLEVLLRARLDSNLTQGDVVQLSGHAFTVQQLSKWERGQVTPTPESQAAWRKALEGYLP